MASSMSSVVFGPSFLTEDDIPGSSLNGKDPNRDHELKFWLKYRGDSCKGLSTKAQLCKRVSDYLKANIAHLLVDPDENCIYTRRKQRLLGLEIEDEVEAHEASESETIKKVAFPKSGWRTSLEKSPCRNGQTHIKVGKKAPREY
ncbi:hypothetical protein QZH41_018432 [Actinostola sp. cb2023]|nr:hypothetical protein QZH41_018432 [Actinostola sp. cb2023]